MDSPAGLQNKSKEELVALVLSGNEAARAAEARCAVLAATSTAAEAKAAEAEVEKLQQLIRQFQRALYGRRSEKLSDDQLALGLEDIAQCLSAAEAALTAARAELGGTPAAKEQTGPRRNRGALPRHLPREEAVIAPDTTVYPCCGGALHVIGEDVSEQLDYVPAQFKVRVIRRPRYGCRACEGAPVQAPAPARPIDGGLPSEGLIAHVLVSKYLDHLPLYRQAQIYTRQGIALDRSSLTNWTGRAAWWLRPLYERLLKEITASAKIFADDTPVPVLDPGRGWTKTGRLWAYARDDRPWQSGDPPSCAKASAGRPAVAYVYATGRSYEHPIAHLKAFKGILQVDAFQGFDRLAARRLENDVLLVHCWAHTRRRFHDVHQATQSPIAADALKTIAALYRIEAAVRGSSAEERQAARQEKSRPVLEAFKPWLEAQAATISAKNKFAEAIRYALSRWHSLTRFLEDGRIEIDTNTVERTMRPIALGRKNHLFAGSDGGAETWAIVASLIQSARLNDVDPFAYLKHVLERMVQGHTIDRIDELLPWNVAKTSDQAA